MQTHWLSDIYTCNLTKQLYIAYGGTHMYTGTNQAAGDYIPTISQPWECAISFIAIISSAINIVQECTFSDDCQLRVDQGWNRSVPLIQMTHWPGYDPVE